MSALDESSAPGPAGGAPPRLAVRELSMSRGGRILLSEVAFEVGPGELVAVFGPPGAGKGALMDWLAGLARADRGAALFEGERLGPRGRALRAKIGLLLGVPTLDPRLTCRQNLLFAAQLYGVPTGEARQRVAQLLPFLGLDPHTDESAGELGPALGRRLELARALIHDPTLLLLFEPFGDLEPRARERAWRRLDALRAAKELSILVATENPEDAERADRVVLLDRGQVVADEPPSHLLTRIAGDVVVIEAAEAEQLAAELAERFDLSPRVAASRAQVLLEVPEGHELIPQLVAAFPAHRFTRIGLRRPDLTDVFALLTGGVFGEGP